MRLPFVMRIHVNDHSSLVKLATKGYTLNLGIVDLPKPGDYESPKDWYWVSVYNGVVRYAETCGAAHKHFHGASYTQKTATDLWTGDIEDWA